jgi:hypothetical protein
VSYVALWVYSTHIIMGLALASPDMLLPGAVAMAGRISIGTSGAHWWVFGEQALTHAINAKNEAKFAGIAAQKGGHLSVVRPRSRTSHVRLLGCSGWVGCSRVVVVML